VRLLKLVPRSEMNSRSKTKRGKSWPNDFGSVGSQARARGTREAGLVEFTLTFLLVLTVVFGTIEFCSLICTFFVDQHEGHDLAVAGRGLDVDHALAALKAR
jgi:hypothetical protein